MKEMPQIKKQEEALNRWDAVLKYSSTFKNASFAVHSEIVLNETCNKGRFGLHHSDLFNGRQWRWEMKQRRDLIFIFARGELF